MLDTSCPAQLLCSPTMSSGDKDRNGLADGHQSTAIMDGSDDCYPFMQRPDTSSQSPGTDFALDSIIQDLKESFDTTGIGAGQTLSAKASDADQLYPSIDGATIPLVTSLLNGSSSADDAKPPAAAFAMLDQEDLLNDDDAVHNMSMLSTADIKSLLKDEMADDFSTHSADQPRDHIPEFNGRSPPPSKVNFLNIAGRTQQPETLKIMGFDFPVHAVDGQSSSDAYVCITDVFRTFFASYHWDEFKDILDRNNVQPFTSMARYVRGVPEVFDVIGVKEVERLLLNNQARKDGFVRCTNLNDEDKVIMTNERQAGELVSGIRTRHSDRSDISYVEVNGCPIPSIAVFGVRSVRVVDLLNLVLMPNQANITIKHVDCFLNICQLIGVVVSKCSHNQKSRLVVCANSYRSSSLHVVSVDSVPTITGHFKQLVDKNGPVDDIKTLQALIRSEENERNMVSNSSSSSGRFMFDSVVVQKGGLRQQQQQANTVLQQQQFGSVRGRRPKQRYGDFQFALPASLVQPSSSSPHGEQRSRRGRKRKNEQQSTADTSASDRRRIPEDNLREQLMMMGSGVGGSYYGGRILASSSSSPGCSASTQTAKPWTPMVTVKVDLSKDHTLGADQVNLKRAHCDGNYDSTVYKTYVKYSRDPPLPLLVYSHRGYVGPQGLYHGDLFVDANAPCIWCISCNKIYSVSIFTLHVHGHRRIVTRVYLMLVPGVRLTRRQSEVWNDFRCKLHQYRLDVLDDESAFRVQPVEWGGSTKSAMSKTGEPNGGNAVVEHTAYEAAQLFNRASRISLPECRVAMSTEPRRDLEALLVHQFHAKKSKRPLMMSSGLFQTFRESGLTKWNQV